MSRLGLAVSLMGSLLLAGCMQTTLSPSTDASLTPRDRQLLAHPPYAEVKVPEQYQRHIVDYDRREAPGTILVDTDARYLYYVLPARPTRSARGRSICMRATRTRCTGSTAPTSRNISAKRSPPAASA